MRSYLLAMLLILSVVGSAMGEPTTLPAKLQPFAQLAADCARYQTLIDGARWRVVYTEDFSGKHEPTWSSPTLTPLAGQKKIDVTSHPHLRLTKDDDRSVLYFQAPFEQGLLHLGPKVKGDFAFEVSAKAISERPCDISLFLDRIDAGPGFQFGANYNTRNKLWIGPVRNKPDPALSAESSVDLGNDRLIEKNVWHRVRMEVRQGQITASVDGKVVGTSKLADGYVANMERQPLVYVYSSAIELKEARLEAMAPGEKRVDENAAWEQVFGKTTPKEVKVRIESLTDLLADDDWTTRDGAQTMLRQMGSLAVGPLELAAIDGLPEQQMRARELLRTMRPPATRASVSDK